MKELSYSDRLAKLGLMTLEERHNKSDLIEMFKLVNGFSNVSLETFFEFVCVEQNQRSLAQTEKEEMLHYDVTSLLRELLTNRIVLSEATVSAMSVNGFKNHLLKDGVVKMGLLKD